MMGLRRKVLLMAPLLLPSAVVGQSKPKIPLTLGFANLSGDDLAPLLKEDVAALSPLFARVAIADPRKVPICQVLFVYTHLNADGSIRGSTSLDIRQIAQLSKASIVVLASPNPGDSLTTAAGIAGPKSANLVLTTDRKGAAFPTFYRSLFERMRDGQELLLAWVELAPQGPVTPPTPAPVSALLAEGGRMSFPKAAPPPAK